MSVRTRTLVQLRDGVAERANVNIAASGVKHTTALVNVQINRAIQRWLSLIADSGDNTNMVRSTVSTSTSTTRGASNWAPSEYIVAPNGCMQIRGLDLQIGGGSLVPMMTLDEAERDDQFLVALPWLINQRGRPVFYRQGGLGPAGENLIRIFPAADAVYSIDILYIPAHVDISADGDTIDFINGGEEWVINDVASQVLRQDRLAGSAEYAACIQDNRQLERDLAFELAKRAPVRKVDSVGRRKALLYYAGLRLP